MASSYCICRPRDGYLYVEVPNFDSLRNLLLTQKFRDEAHFRTLDGSVPYLGGGIAFYAPYLIMLGVKPLWYPMEGGNHREAVRELVRDDVYLNEEEAEDFEGHHYRRECEWLGKRGLRFSLGGIAGIWIGPGRDKRSVDERVALLRETVPETIPILTEAPEPTGIRPC